MSLRDELTNRVTRSLLTQAAEDLATANERLSVGMTFPLIGLADLSKLSPKMVPLLCAVVRAMAAHSLLQFWMETNGLGNGHTPLKSLTASTIGLSLCTNLVDAMVDVWMAMPDAD